MVALASSGCALLPQQAALKFTDSTVVTIPYEEDMSGRPVIEGSINGVHGKFLIDTGASVPLLTTRAVQQGKILLSSKTRLSKFIGDDAPSKFRRVEGDVILNLAKVNIIWSDVFVAPGLDREEWLGVIDYQTLKTAYAVIDVKKKTITLFQNESKQVAVNVTPFHVASVK